MDVRLFLAADWGESDRLELRLSGNLMLRFFKTDRDLILNLISTKNADENPTLVVDLGDMDKRVPISTIETKLNGLRTIYAIFYLIQNGRAKKLQLYIIKYPEGDIERALLKKMRNSILRVFHMVLGTDSMGKTKKAYKALASTAGLVFAREREAYLRKLEADARLKDAEADVKKLKFEKKNLNYIKNSLTICLKQVKKWMSQK